MQEALLAAARWWPQHGEPGDPAAWIFATARRKAIDLHRRERTTERTREALRHNLAVQSGRDAEDDLDAEADLASGPVNDDRLRLIFTCCHPALALEARVALTLKTIARLETQQIARAFLVSEPTMAQRIVRAKRKIRDAGIPYEIPGEGQVRARLAGVLAVIYLVFNEGYKAASGDALLQPGLCAEAIRLARLLADLLPDEPEVLGLLALMLLHDARREARVDGHGDLVTLEQQDRTRWDREQIAEGVALVEAALRRGRPGSFQIQAAIAALHAEPHAASDTDWRQIALLYRELGLFLASPIVALNHAAAVAMAEGPDAGLRLLDEIARERTLAGYHLYHAARADLLRRAGSHDEAATAYRRALRHCTNAVEVRYLNRRLAELASSTPGSDEGT